MKIMSSTHPCGIALETTKRPGPGDYMPLQKARIHVHVVDGTSYVSCVPKCTQLTHGCREPVSAIVTVTQQFWHYSRNTLQRARYVFPVPAGAAVCGFEMRAEDGTVIVAEAKEKEEAAREHLAALRHGRMTGLVEYVSDDSKSVYYRCITMTR